jgi:hypothetical protein
MKLFRITFTSALLLAVAVNTWAMSVKSDYQKSYDFSRLRTFAFKTERVAGDPLAANTIEAGRIQSALTSQLEMNGFSPTVQEPDFVVAFYSRTRERTQVQSTGFGGPGFGWGYGIPFRSRWRWGLGPDIWTTTYIQGCVMADFIDPRTNELVWRGVVKDTVNGIGQSEKQANEAAKDLVKQFTKDVQKVNKSKS